MTSENAKPIQPSGVSLKKAMLSGVAWTIAGFGIANVLKLGNSMIMTRLLVPKVFGIMSLVYVLMQGLQMFSDVGIGPALIQHKRGEEPVFINTAWTIQVFRGFALWICAMILAWPASIWFKEPELIKIIPFASMTVAISGFSSTSLSLLNRKLILGKQTAIDLFTQATGMAITIAIAWYWRSVWVIVIGNIFGAAMKTVLSHVSLPGIPNRFTYDKTCARELIRFGRWIFISTVFTFFTLSGDRLVLGRFMSKSELGVYSIAINWSMLAISVMTALGSRVLFPLYAELARGDVVSMRSRFIKTKIGLLAMALPLPCLMAIMGRYIINTAYISDYKAAGWMVEVLSVGVVFQVINQTISPIILAKGDSFRHMCSMILLTSLSILAMYLGGYFGGVNGIIWGVASIHIIYYFALALLVKNTGTWMPKVDFAFMSVSIALILICKHALGHF